MEERNSSIFTDAASSGGEEGHDSHSHMLVRSEPATDFIYTEFENDDGIAKENETQVPGKSKKYENARSSRKLLQIYTQNHHQKNKGKILFTPILKMMMVTGTQLIHRSSHYLQINHF